MKKLLTTWILALAFVASAQAQGNVNVTNPATRPVPVTTVTKVGGATQTTTAAYSTRVTTNATTTVTAATAYVSTVQVSVSAAGSAWTITIRSKEGTPKILYSVTAAVGSATVVNAQVPIAMLSGIDIVTAGTTPGTADIWITYSQ